jgi:hypothetical protein
MWQARSTGPVTGGITNGSIMSKAAFVILASGDSPESLGRVVNALMGAYEMMESGQEVKIIFDGAGTHAAASLSEPNHKYHKYHDLFKLVQSKVSGICSYCANAYGVAPKVERLTCLSRTNSRDIQALRTCSIGNTKF